MFLVCGEHLSFSFQKNPKQHGQGNFLENCHIPRKKAMKSPRFLEDLGQISRIFF
jgi:hypothetical protein